MATTTKVTISLPVRVLGAVDAIAKERKAPRSNVIAELIRRRIEELEDEAMIEGYKALAKENANMAEQALPASLEVLPEWK